MCGICGVLDFAAGKPDERVIARMNDRLQHRGPDHGAVFVAPHLMLGHRRLSIIDLTDTGLQPMKSSDGSVVMVYNGETYNFLELRAELEALGHVFRGTSDSEVVLAAYREWGTDSFVRLNGMFAMAIWDARSERLHLVRDRFGIKPLYYRNVGSALVFGSEIKALLEYGGSRELDMAFLREYMYYGNSHLSRSAFAGIEQLLPGHFLSVGREGRQLQAYWRVEDLPAREGRLDEFVARSAELLEAAVKRHLISDVPVAVFLSGGIDSSAITALAARHYSGTLKTFSMGFDFSPHDDERPTAKSLAESVGAEHHELFVSTDNLDEAIEALVRSHDEPFADSANIALMLLCRQLRELGVKVALQGDGGDEIFAGYRRYNVLSREVFWRLASPLGLQVLKAIPDRPAKFRLRRFLSAMAQSDPIVRLALLMTTEDRESQPERLLSRELQERSGGFDPLAAYLEVGEAFRDRDPVQRSLHMDCKLLLPGQFLPKVDRSTMSQSIETRVPFLDTELADYVIPIASKHKVKGFQKKYILRRALRGTVPDHILDRPKQGFGVPISEWLGGRLRGYMESVLFDASTARSGLFDRAQLEACAAEHAAGTRDNGQLLYKALLLALWHREYIASS